MELAVPVVVLVQVVLVVMPVVPEQLTKDTLAVMLVQHGLEAAAVQEQ